MPEQLTFSPFALAKGEKASWFHLLFTVKKPSSLQIDTTNISVFFKHRLRGAHRGSVQGLEHALALLQRADIIALQCHPRMALIHLCSQVPADALNNDVLPNRLELAAHPLVGDLDAAPARLYVRQRARENDWWANVGDARHLTGRESQVVLLKGARRSLRDRPVVAAQQPPPLWIVCSTLCYR